ncbi:MAG: Gfo/Idh/MocA family oxidoreductase [Chloroflexi bacterium]|nr:Gfo/Idh/MocA family oxidoreductase [Chloroflexota bacterium]
MNKLYWGLLSTARISHAVMPPIRLSHRSELLGVGSRDQVKAEAYAREHEIPRAYGSYEALLADPDINVIYNPLPNHLHAEWTIKAAEAGKHVLCEKPLALTVAEVDRVMAAARANHVVVAEAFMYKHHPQTLKALELLKNRPLGELLTIKGVFTFDLSPRPDDIRWVPEYGGGSIWDVGCYPISFTRLIAQAEPIEVLGWQTTSASGVDEVFVGQMRFANGLLAQFESGFHTPYRCWMEVVGTRGSMFIGAPFKPADREFITLNYGDRSEQIEVGAGQLYQGEIEDMENAVLDGKPQRIPLDDSRNNVALILACLESARTGQIVRL